ncbi:hypothetical protein ACFQMH_07670 [Streptomyces viridiviolaceus]|uniref:Integral membrane protein n=1 Tax=Streptomyces viridiviolaceus TaxID=68282 RepID=A0ABW2DZ57_9ACTN|nr:hypothetical protein [Streptomyces viridiviolaceus]
MAVGLPLGLLLGAVGATIRRPGAVGLLAALTVPVGAALQMVVLPPQPLVNSNLDVVVAEAIVWTAAVLGAGWAVYRFQLERHAVDVGPRTGEGVPSIDS